jgi:demethylmenaquinone methyltransferase/2-methoxy-6-polyprenyl-1,4-benzoquinol methylase
VTSIRSKRKQHALELFEELPARYDELGAALSFFQDPRWRRAAVEAVEAGPEDRVAADPRLAERITLVEGEAEHLPFSDREFDHLTFTYLLRYVDDPAATLRELARVVKPGGRISSLEFRVPTGVWLWPWRLYTRVGLPVLGRLASRSWFEAGRFLGPSIEGFYREYPLRRQVALWEAAGIGQVEARPMSLGGGIVIWGTVGG